MATRSRPTMCVSPAEPPWLKKLLAERFDIITNATLTERRGVDISWTHDGLDAWHGVQRKEINDLIASVGDGRLQREIPQMVAGVVTPHLIIEGSVRFTNEGVLVRDGWGQQFTKKQWRGLMWSIQGAGVGVSYAKGGTETVDLIVDMHTWSQKSRHSTLRQRPGVPTNDWGTRENKAWARHLLQGFEGIGPETADAIIARYGVPFAWSVTEAELREVKGVGKVRARRLMEALSA